MAGGFGFSDGSFGGNKTTSQKQSTAAQQLRSSLSRIASQAEQNKTIQSYGNRAQTFASQFDNRIANPLENVGASILNVLNRPSQGVLRGIQAQQTGTNIPHAIAQGLSGPIGQHQINFREALNTDNWQTGKGFVSPQAEQAAATQSFIPDDVHVNPIVRALDKGLAGAADLGGTVVTDPMTYVPFGALARVAELAGVGKVATKVAQTAPAAKIADAFNPAAKTARELGPSTAEDVSQGIAGMRGQAAEKITDLQRNFNSVESDLAKTGVDPAKFNIDVATPALESGNWQQVSQGLRDAGKVHEARYLDAQHALRQKLTDIQVSNGSLKNPLPVDTYMYHAATPEYQSFLKSLPPAEAEAGFGYKPQTPGAFIGEQYGRRFMPGATIAEKNAAVFEKSGGKVKTAFEPNSAKALGIKAQKVIESDAKLGLINYLGTLNDAAGNKLVHHIPDVSEHVRDLRTSTRAQLKDLDRQIGRAKTAVQRDAVVDSGARSTNKIATELIQRGSKRVQDLEELVRKAESRTVASGIDKRAASEAGRRGERAVAEKVTGKLSSAADINAELRAVLSDASIPAGVRAEIRKDYAAARRAAASEASLVRSQNRAARLTASQANNAETARVTTRSVQQRIGVTTAAAKYENVIQRSLRRQLAQAQRDLDIAVRRQAQSTLRGAASKEAHVNLLAKRSETVQASKAQMRELRSTEKIPRPAGYAKVSLGPAGHAYMPSSLADRLNALSKHEDTGEFEKLMGTGTQVMKNLLLNPVPFAIARTTRDLFPNLVNMVAKGFRDPQSLVEAGKVMRMLNKSYKAGLTHEEAIAALPVKYRTLEEEISKRGAVNSGQLRSDVSHGIGLGQSQELGARVKRGLNVKDAEGYATRHGARLNTLGDDLSRRAMFYDQVKQHGDFKIAAKNAKEAMFDFADLGDAEKKLRKYIVFWTWMARNAKLQAWTLAHVPQVPLNVARGQHDLQGTDTGNTSVANYALNADEVPLFKVGKTPVLGTIQSPFNAASQTLQPLADIASYFAPSKYTTQQGLQGGLAGLASNVGGLPGTLTKTALEEAAGVNLFTGAPIKGTKSDVIKQALLNVTPRGTQYASIGGSLAGNDQAAKTAALMKLLGVSTTLAGDKQNLGETYRRNRAAQDAANQQGIPTVTQLKRTGKAKAASK